MIVTSTKCGGDRSKKCEAEHSELVVSIIREEIRRANYVTLEIVPSWHRVHHARERSSNHTPLIIHWFLSKCRLYEAIFCGVRCVLNSWEVAKTLHAHGTSNELRVEARMQYLVEKCSSMCKGPEKQTTEYRRCNEWNLSINRVEVD